MAEDMDVVKELHEAGIDSLFINRFLLNMKVTLKECLDRFSKEIEREPHARTHIVRILLGYLNYKDGNCNEAIKNFETVVSDDANNINSLLHLLYIYEGMKQQREVEEYKKKIKDILSNGLLTKKSIVRAKYELAGIMSAIDAQLQPGGIPVIRSLFQEAIGCSEVPENEKLEWLFGYAFFCFNIDSAYGKTQPEHFKESMEYFYRIVTMEKPVQREDADEFARQETEFNDLVPKAWCFMGTLLSRYDRFTRYEELKCVIDCPKGYSACTLHSCMEKANEKANRFNKPVILRRTGLVYMDMESMVEAEQYFKDAVKLDPENGYAYNLLGRWHLKKYKLTPEQDKTSEKTDLLKEAIGCFKDALKRGFILWHCYLDLADAHFLNGDCSDAIRRCQQSEKHGGHLDKELYELWAKIYVKMDYPEEAKKMRSKAEKLATGQYDEKYDFGFVYYDDDIHKVVAILDNLKKQLCLRIFFLDGDVLSLEPWDTLDKSCCRILVFCSGEFFPSNSEVNVTLKSIINGRFSRGDKSTITLAKLPGCKDIPRDLNSLIEVDADKYIDEINRDVNCLDKRD